MHSKWLGSFAPTLVLASVLTLFMTVASLPAASASAASGQRPKDDASLVADEKTVEAVRGHQFSAQELAQLEQIEQQAQELEDFAGGAAVYIAIGSGVLVAAVVVLLILLLID